MKVIHGECTRCGLCGCWDRPEENGKEWCEGLPEHAFDWYRQHPEDEEPIFMLLRIAVDGDQTTVTIPGVGIFSFVYHPGVGVGTSEDDKSCPFLDQVAMECQLWGTSYLPVVCATTPQNLVREEQIDQWIVDHPQCGLYWTDE